MRWISMELGMSVGCCRKRRIKTHLNPIPEFKLSFEKDNDKTFVIVEVMKGQQTPYYYEGDGQLIAFMRIGNESSL